MSDYGSYMLNHTPEVRKQIEDALMELPDVEDQSSYRAFLKKLGIFVAVGKVTPAAAEAVTEMANSIYKSLVFEDAQKLQLRVLDAKKKEPQQLEAGHDTPEFKPAWEHPEPVPRRVVSADEDDA
ncbi:MAG: hypothetical protein ACYTFV_00910 [Planctomycetota bacterium]|jgi:hypothetical protein